MESKRRIIRLGVAIPLNLQCHHSLLFCAFFSWFEAGRERTALYLLYFWVVFWGRDGGGAEWRPV